MAQTKASTTSSSGSRLGASVVVRGMIRTSGDLEIQGRVEGSVQVEGNLDIDEGARIRSALNGGRVTIRGAVLGDVSGSESVVLEAGARVVGDLSAPSIGIRPGGLLRGHVASGDLSGARASNGAARTSAPRAVRQPPVAAPTKRDADPPKHVETPRVIEAPPFASRAGEARPEPAPAPHTKPAASLQERKPAARPAPAPRAAVAAKPVEPTNDDPLGDLIRQAPPPIMPSLQRGAKAQLKKKAR